MTAKTIIFESWKIWRCLFFVINLCRIPTVHLCAVVVWGGNEEAFFLLQRSNSAVAAVLRLQPTPTHIMSRRPFISPNLQLGFVWSAAAAERWPSFFRHWLARPLPRMNRPTNGAGGNVTVYYLAFPRWSRGWFVCSHCLSGLSFREGTWLGKPAFLAWVPAAGNSMDKIL